MLNIHRLDATRHAAFLAEQRKDPVTRKAFHAGDEIVVCAACGSAFSVDSWNFLGGEHDGQSETLRDIAQGPVTLQGRRFSMTNAGTTPANPIQIAPPGLVPVDDSPSFDFRTPLIVVVLLGVLLWLVSLAVRPRVESEPGAASQVVSAPPTTSENATEVVDRERQLEESRLAAAAERTRVEQGLAGEWVAGSSRLAITADGTAFSAVYRFPDPGPFSREGHQTMKGELLPDNDLRLTNIYHGKLANPLDYFSGDFDGVTLVSLSGDGTFVTARLDDGRSLVLTRVVGDPDPDSTGVESPEQQREASEGPDLHTNEEIDSSTENTSVRDEGPGAAARSPSRPRTAPERNPSGVDDDAWRRGSTPERLPRRVGGNVEAPVLLTRTEPRYTEVARKARISGIVIVECVIDENGNVQDVRVLKPLPFGLDRAAADAVKQWTFRPGMLNGQPVEVVYNLTVTFKLN